MKIIKFKTAKEFIKKLNEIRGQGIIFRGLGSYRAELLPTGWRFNRYPESCFSFEDPNHKELNLIKEIRTLRINLGHTEKLLNYLMYEMELVHSFIQKSNRVRLPVENVLPFGFALPLKRDDRIRFWQEILRQLPNWIKNYETKDFKTNTDNFFMPGGILSPYLCTHFDMHAIAYAQHHGIPTRYIDFTHNPLIAAWFGINQYKKFFKKKRAAYIGVLALNVEPNRCNSGIFKTEYRDLFEIVDNFKISRFNNLYHQEGLFLHMKHANWYFYLNGKWPTINEYLMTLGTHFHEDNFSLLCLPVNQITELENNLSSYKIDMPSLMPSFDNVACFINSCDDFYS